MRRGARRAACTASILAVAALAGCSSAHRPGAAGTSSAPPPLALGAALAGSQGCLGGSDQIQGARIDWAHLRNPILAYPDSAAKDEGVRLVNGRWHMFFSSIIEGPVHWRIASATSTDLRTWSSLEIWPDQAGVEGVASPDITRRPDGLYVVTYESIPHEVTPPGEDKIYYRTSPDLLVWSAPHPLAYPQLHPSPHDRVIDPALAWTTHGLFLGYKVGLPSGSGAQAFEVAWSPSGSLDGPWQLVGRPDIRVYGDTVENYEFLPIDGRWRLLATSNNFDRAWLFTMAGDPASPAGWLHWGAGRQLETPVESWNRGTGITGSDYELANSAYLCDARAVDGYFYLFYAASTELTQFGGWGHAKIGVARSRDLISWRVPCEGGTALSDGGCS